MQPPSSQGGKWTVRQIFVFNGGDGGNPGAGLLPGTKGDFYGTDSGGPPPFGGLVFHLKPPSGSRKTWTIESLYQFKGKPDGEGPQEIILGNGRSIYGTTLDGGTGSCSYYGCGTVFEVSLP
jgi:hypothetical protein